MPKTLEELLGDTGCGRDLKDRMEMGRRLRALDRRHQVGDPVSMGIPPSSNLRCVACHEEWPCPDRRILDGETE